MSLSFGTDGVRGVANVELTPEFTMALGRAAARVLGSGYEHPFLVGRDTRVSGTMLEAALTAGLASEGVDVLDLGVMPTPGVAAVAAEMQLPAAMISASHNEYRDNGIKFFSVGGRKLSDETESRLEEELERILKGEAGNPRTEVGKAERQPKAHGWYAEQLAGSLEGRTLEGLKVVIDCANGAGYEVAPDALTRAGAHVEVINDRPDGTNINEACGSTHTESLQAAVLEMEADLGLAFDGDADRVLAVDDKGQLVDGDQIIALLAIDQQRQGRLVNNTVVVTVMSNLGFRRAMEREGITVVETKVGDRYVLEALELGGHGLGGEQSGHVIFRNLATTGDGILTGLHLADLIVRSQRNLSELAPEAMTRLPQVLRNVRVSSRDLDNAQSVWEEVRSVEAELGGEGRVLLRGSGTEAVVRVMVEAVSEAQATEAADRLCLAVERALA